jgi:uncharacterized SAM-dependent methyltransferase
MRLLRQTAKLCGPEGGLLLGVDMKKDPQVLNAAYNDRQGVTAAFNRNILVRINRELGADFVVEEFSHLAFYNANQGRIEMHLVSQREQTVHAADSVFFFKEGESICTEYSYKYDQRQLCNLAKRAGFTVKRFWTDERRYFSVNFLARS